MLASDVDNPNFTGAQDPDSVMIARFYVRACKNDFQSEKQGRPIFEDKLCVEYYPAGNTLLKMDVVATDFHKQRFHRQWAYYERTQGADSRDVGTPISEWPILTPAAVENLRAIKIHTIENVAAMSDGALQQIGMAAGMAAHVLRAKAQAYLTAASNSAIPQAQAAEIEKLKKEQEERDAKHAAEIEELRALILAQSEKPSKKREWTPEQKEAARERMKKAREAKQQKAE